MVGPSHVPGNPHMSRNIHLRPAWAEHIISHPQMPEPIPHICPCPQGFTGLHSERTYADSHSYSYMLCMYTSPQSTCMRIRPGQPVAKWR